MRAWTAKSVETLLKAILDEASSEEGLDGDTFQAIRRTLYQIEKERKRDADSTVAERVDGRVTVEFPAEQLSTILSAAKAGKRNCDSRARNTKSEQTLTTVKAQGVELERLAISLGGLLEEG